MADWKSRAKRVDGTENLGVEPVSPVEPVPSVDAPAPVAESGWKSRAKKVSETAPLDALSVIPDGSAPA